jgi:NAD(P)-dependent dehydrogenase (short-subunit alcohol dehydrogenase family)
MEQFGKIDYVCHSAGIGAKGVAGIAETERGSLSAAEFQRFMEVNVTGTMLVIQEAGKVMASGGSLVVLGSANSVMATPGIAQYVSSKHAVLGLMRTAGKYSPPEIRGVANGLSTRSCPPQYQSKLLMPRMGRNADGCGCDSGKSSAG